MSAQEDFDDRCLTRDDILPARTDRERAAGYLKRSLRPCPKAAQQTEALFAELEPTDRKLIVVDGWPDYAADMRRRGGGPDGP